MADNLVRVDPGDLITADMFNALVDYVEQLRTDVDSLGTIGAAVAITSVTPSSAAVGDIVTVRGRNFVNPVSLNQVTVGGALITSFRFGSNTTQLIFAVPNLNNLPRLAAIVVTNANGQDADEMTVEAAPAVPAGELVFTEDFAHLTGTTITPGATLDLVWQVEAITTMAEDFDLSLDFTNPNGTTVGSWQSAAVIEDTNNNAITSVRLLPRVAGDPSTGPTAIAAQLTVPANMAPGDSISVALHLTSRRASGDPDLNRASAPVALNGGQTVAAGDPRVSFDAPVVSSALTLDAGTVEVPIGVSNGIVQVTANFSNSTDLGSVAGNFQYTAEVIPPAPGVWSIGPTSPTGSPESDGTSQNIEATPILLTADPQPSRLLRITAQRTTGGPPFTSFTNIPIRPAP